MVLPTKTTRSHTVEKIFKMDTVRVISYAGPDCSGLSGRIGQVVDAVGDGQYAVNIGDYGVVVLNRSEIELV
jgi:hypothetical protein